MPIVLGRDSPPGQRSERERVPRVGPHPRHHFQVCAAVVAALAGGPALVLVDRTSRETGPAVRVGRVLSGAGHINGACAREHA